MIPSRFTLVLCALLPALACSAPAERNVILVTIDGLRWQEVFRGADESFITTEGGGIAEKQLAEVRERWAAPSSEERRRKLMPFLWTELAARGQLFGNRDRGSRMNVANTEWFSYPGYNELLCGFADPLITSNAPIPNRNVTVLEWLDRQPGFAGRVAGSVTWHVLAATVNVGRSRLPLWVSSQNPALARRSAQFADIDRWMRDVPLKARDEHYDAFGFRAALELVDVIKPRVLYVALGEPDTDAHRRRYDAYLESIHRADRFIRELWEHVQAQEQYRDRTTLLISTDHGRGRTPEDWNNHNKKTPGSDESWLAALGPGIAVRGEHGETEPVHSAQIAATVAAVVGVDLRQLEPRAAPPVAAIVGAAAVK